MKHLIAATAITALTLVGFGSIASAAYADETGFNPSPDGKYHVGEDPNSTLCYQPFANPPMMVLCDSTRATTPYVPDASYSDDNPPSTPNSTSAYGEDGKIHVGDGDYCQMPDTNPPGVAPCDEVTPTGPVASTTTIATPQVRKAVRAAAPRIPVTFGDALIEFAA